MKGARDRVGACRRGRYSSRASPLLAFCGRLRCASHVRMRGADDENVLSVVWGGDTARAIGRDPSQRSSRGDGVRESLAARSRENSVGMP